MKRIFSIIFYLVTVSLSAQPFITTAEKYQIGQSFIYQQIDVDPETIETAGQNLVWDLSHLKELNKRTTMEILDPSKSKYASFFPGADILEKDTDGTYVFSKQSEEESTLLGFVDEAHDFRINYPQNQLFMKRPIEYGSYEKSNYTTSYKVSNYTFSGHGKTHIEASAYGKLILPHAVYENVLLIILEQEQWDTLAQYNSVSHSKTRTLIWFEIDNPAPLLRISVYESEQGKSISSSWLVKDQVSSTRSIRDRSQIKVYPNPAVDRVTIETDLDIIGRKFRILDISGKAVVLQGRFLNDGTIDISGLPEGTYILNIDGSEPQLLIKSL